MTIEFEQNKSENQEEKPFNKPVKVERNRPAVVNSEFILQVHFGQGELRLGLPAKIGIFALSQIPIQREDVKVKQAKSQKPKTVGKVTFLSLSFNRGEILIGRTNVSLKNRTFDTFSLNLQSSTPIEIRHLNHDLDVRDKTVAQSILNPDWFESSLGPATEDDFKNRKRFEIRRALEKFQQGAATSVELDFLKKKGLIPYTHSRFRRHK